jgi:putative sigma-54 modulation protein
MDVSVTFRHMEPTAALKAYANERVEKVTKQLTKESAATVVLSVERHNHHAEVKLRSGGVAMRGHETSTDMYHSIDQAVEKIERQLARYRGKLRRHEHPRPSRQVLVHHIETAEDAAGEAQEEATVKQTRAFDAHPLSTDQAIMQLDLLNQQFLVFVNVETGGVNVLYRRDQGGFGLIDTHAMAKEGEH